MIRPPRLKIRGPLVAVAVVAAIGGSVVAATSMAGGETPSLPFDRIGTQGTAVTSLLPRDRNALGRMHGTTGKQVNRLGTSAGRSYYRIGSNCYAAGPAGPPAEYSLGQIICVNDFPSTNRPILDFTVFHGDPTRRDVTVWRSEGIAADGVVKVALEDAAGEIADEARVANNTYSFASIPAGKFTALVAFDADGKEIYRQPVLPPR